MEAILALIFILFSLVSAYLDRRKRAQQLEESRRRAAEQDGPSPGSTQDRPVLVEEEEEDERPFFPFDPFELEPAKPKPAAPPEPSAEELEKQQREELEKKEREAEALIAKAERKAKEIAEQSRQRRPSPRPAVDQLPSLLESQKKRGRYAFNPKTAREAVIYAEIFNRPKWNPDND